MINEYPPPFTNHPSLFTSHQPVYAAGIYPALDPAPLNLLEKRRNYHVSDASAGFKEVLVSSNAHVSPRDRSETVYAGGFLMHTVVPVKNPDIQKKVLQMEESETVRNMDSRWWLPFVRKLKITYPNGLIHSIVTAATPIDDRNSQIVQFAYRSDTEEQAAAKDIIAFDRQVTNEDREILESTDFDVSVDLSRRIEEHMAVDRPGLVMRKQLMKLFNEHGETDVVLD